MPFIRFLVLCITVFVIILIKVFMKVTKDSFLTKVVVGVILKQDIGKQPD